MAGSDMHENVPGNIDSQSNSYADRTKMNVRYDQKLKRNVLDIEVEKDSIEDEMILSEETVAELLTKINMDILTHVEGYQVSHGRKKSKIEVLCKAGLDLEQFCMYERLEVEHNVKTNFIRPAGRREVEVTVTGLGFNIPDSLVQEYISKFGGKLVTNDVIYGKYSDGPFRGKLNGIRKYQVDFTESKKQMGTFHILDGKKVKVFYRGNSSTCGWCHCDRTRCPGGGLAKSCKEKETTQVVLVDHMKKLWKSIDFDPQVFEIKEVEYDDVENLQCLGGDRKVLNTAHFQRKVDKSDQFSRSIDQEKVNDNKEVNGSIAIRIKNLPAELSDEKIVEFLDKEVDKRIKVENIIVEKTDHNSTNVILGPEPCADVIAKAAEVLDYKIAKKCFFKDRRLYVQPYIHSITERNDKRKAIRNDSKERKKNCEMKASSKSKEVSIDSSMMSKGFLLKK